MINFKRLRSNDTTSKINFKQLKSNNEPSTINFKQLRMNGAPSTINFKPLRTNARCYKDKFKHCRLNSNRAKYILKPKSKAPETRPQQLLPPSRGEPKIRLPRIRPW